MTDCKLSGTSASVQTIHNKKRLEVDAWRPDVANPPVAPLRIKREFRWRFKTRVAAMAGTLLLHVFAYLSFNFETSKDASLPDKQAVRLKTPAVPLNEHLMLMNWLPETTVSKPKIDVTSSVSLALPTASSALLEPDSLPRVNVPQEYLSGDTQSMATMGTENSDDRAGLFGIYKRQIDARIGKAWRRPRAPILQTTSVVSGNASQKSKNTFTCQVKIFQDADGYVRDVQMLVCAGNPVWRESLLRAILSSSPLPAPPSRSVFTSELVMTFMADEYQAGVLTDDYEAD